MSNKLINTEEQMVLVNKALTKFKNDDMTMDQFCEALEFVFDQANSKSDKFVADALVEEKKRIAGLVVPRAQKLINKVDKGLAKSKETYADMKYIVALLSE